MGIEKERAKQRQVEAGKSSTSGRPAPKDKEPVPTVSPKKLQSRGTVGEKIGVSGKTAEQSAFCIRVMIELPGPRLTISGNSNPENLAGEQVDCSAGLTRGPH